MSRLRLLTTEAITAAALTVLDRNGRESLSMRNVARELGMSTMALYKYVTDRAELERLIVETVLSPIRIDVPSHEPWDERVVLLVQRAFVTRRVRIPRLFPSCWHVGTSHRTVQWRAAMLGIRTDAGFTGTGLVIAQRTIVNYLGLIGLDGQCLRLRWRDEPGARPADPERGVGIRLVARPPAEPLRGLVCRYIGYREDSAAPVRRREVPTGDVTLILSFGPLIRVEDPRSPGVVRHELSSFIVPVNDTWALTEYTGEQFGIQIDMLPLGASLLLGLPMEELVDQVVDLEGLLGPDGPLLTERLAQAPLWTDRFDLLDQRLQALARCGRAGLPGRGVGLAAAQRQRGPGPNRQARRGTRVQPSVPDQRVP